MATFVTTARFLGSNEYTVIHSAIGQLAVQDTLFVHHLKTLDMPRHTIWIRQTPTYLMLKYIVLMSTNMYAIMHVGYQVTYKRKLDACRVK